MRSIQKLSGEKGGHQEHPISKKTSDYEEKHFHAPSGKDDRNTFITGKKPEHPEDVEDKTTKMGSPTKSKVKMGRRKYQFPRRTGRRNEHP